MIDWPNDNDWTRVQIDTDEGFVRTEHLAEIAFVKKGSDRNPYLAKLTLEDGETKDLLWGDYVHVIERGANTSEVRARGMTGTIASNRLSPDSLLEVYFVDVGQGDGVLVRTPDGRHILIDSGLPRSNQLTGKNAADFVDWKFFFDYGEYEIHLDAMVASHSDYDHYGGLWDLVRVDDTEEDPELDTLAVNIDAFYHPGLSRWRKRDPDPFPHKDGLGPNDDGWFVRLLDDRADADGAIIGGASDELGGDWGNFIADLIERNPALTVHRLGVSRELLEGGGVLPVTGNRHSKTSATPGKTPTGTASACGWITIAHASCLLAT
jgi:glyoxylase-like metal-dependent hydrolase (beta-lactamase superfamily II)